LHSGKLNAPDIVQRCKINTGVINALQNLMKNAKCKLSWDVCADTNKTIQNKPDI
jgi:hypothetical protein